MVRNAAGFTLVEVLVAMLVFATGMVAVQALGVRAVAVTVRAARLGEVRALAAGAAELRVAAMRAGGLGGEECASERGLELCVAGERDAGTIRVTVTVRDERLGEPLTLTTQVSDVR